MKLLIADDEQLVRFSIRDILGEIPIVFDIAEVGSGTGAGGTGQKMPSRHSPGGYPHARHERTAGK
ncbi:hypothetical protein [Marispirochaeta aestuarii]|uniref:hypothetical protein n=1 Tax=Marispirochaeta aestuarii TaxID=1963862 RepID=UPI0029C7DEFA|nr:hypothetical protein [Marispirochaeta aestuarii]